MSELKNKLMLIKNEKDTKLIPENIKEGVTILGITGTLSGEGEKEYVPVIPNVKIKMNGTLTQFDKKLIIYNGDKTKSEELDVPKQTSIVGYNQYQTLTVQTFPYYTNGYKIETWKLNNGEEEYKLNDDWTISSTLSNLTITLGNRRYQPTPVEIIISKDTVDKFKLNSLTTRTDSGSNQFQVSYLEDGRIKLTSINGMVITKGCYINITVYFDDNNNRGIEMRYFDSRHIVPEQNDQNIDYIISNTQDQYLFIDFRDVEIETDIKGWIIGPSSEIYEYNEYDINNLPSEDCQANTANTMASYQSTISDSLLNKDLVVGIGRVIEDWETGIEKIHVEYLKPLSDFNLPSNFEYGLLAYDWNGTPIL